MNDKQKMILFGSTMLFLSGIVLYVGSAIFWAVVETGGVPYKYLYMNSEFDIMANTAIVGLVMVAVAVVIWLVMILLMTKKECKED